MRDGENPNHFPAGSAAQQQLSPEQHSMMEKNGELVFNWLPEATSASLLSEVNIEERQESTSWILDKSARMSPMNKVYALPERVEIYSPRRELFFASILVSLN